MRKAAVGVCAVLGFLVSLFCTALPVRAGVSVDVSTGAEFANSVELAVWGGDVINITGDITITDTVTIDKELTINGNGHTLSVPRTGLTDSGVYNTNPSLFRALTTDISGGTVTIQDLTIKGGKSTNEGGRHQE